MLQSLAEAPIHASITEDARTGIYLTPESKLVLDNRSVLLTSAAISTFVLDAL